MICGNRCTYICIHTDVHTYTYLAEIITLRSRVVILEGNIKCFKFHSLHLANTTVVPNKA